MRTFSVINLKGGVGKSISAINIADILAAQGRRVLLIDNDMQGNTSKFFNLQSYDLPSIADLLTVKNYDPALVIRKTAYDGLDLLPANMTLLKANKEILMDVGWVQHTRLRKALRMVAGHYDECIIDNSPYIDMSVINALVATDFVLIPIKADKFTLEGVDQLMESIEQVGEFNENIRVAGGFQTMYRQDKVNVQARERLHSPGMPFPAFDTVIHQTTKVDQSTFYGVPLNREPKKCRAALDYQSLVKEILTACANN